MTEVEKLKQLVAEGYEPHMIIRELSDVEVRSKLPEKFWGAKVYSIPLAHRNKSNMQFCFTEKNTHAYALELVEEARKIIGYDLCVYCSVTSIKAIEGREVEFKSVIESLKELKGWDVRESEYTNVFEVHFKIEGDDREKLNECVENVRRIAVILSIANKMGFSVSHYSTGPRYKAQPFSFKVGLWHSDLKGIDVKDIQVLSSLYKNEKCLYAAKGLQDMYSQTNNSSRITIGWAVLETIFDSRPVHLLEKVEKDQLFEVLDQVDLVEKKIAVLKEKIRNTNIMAKESRNERMAKEIASFLNKDYQMTLGNIKKLARERGNHAHVRSEKQKEIDGFITYIEDILHSYIECHCSVNLNEMNKSEK